MTRYAIVADLHIWNHRAHGGEWKAGLNERGRLCLETLQSAIDKATEAGATHFFILGDVFDQSCPSPQLLAATMERLRISSMLIHVIPGNHDLVSGEQGDHALGPLEYVEFMSGAGVEDGGGIGLHTKVSSLGDVVLVPYRKGPVKEWLEPALAKTLPLLGLGRILMMHAGIETDETPGFLQGAPDAIHARDLAAICQEHGIDTVFAGNWHKPRVIIEDGVRMIQCGTLIPAGFDDESVVGYLWLFDTETRKYERVPIPGPRFYEFDGDDVLTTGLTKLAKHSKDFGETCFYRIRTHQDQVGEVLAALQGYQYEIVLDRTEQEAAAKQAATVTRTAPTIDAAVREYVQAMPLPEGVAREEVLARTRAFLAR